MDKIKTRTTVEKALVLFQNNLKGECIIILNAMDNQEPDGLYIEVEFKTAREMLQYLAKHYGRMIVDFDLYYKLNKN